MEYPKQKFAPTGGSVVVNDAHHERMLGPGWLDQEPVNDTPDPDESGDPDAADPVATDAKKKRR
jgi:hypothetical protein